MRILLIDDSPDVARAVAMLLEREGFDVTWAASGAAALRLVSLEPFDLILSDIWLPDVDGFTLIARIHQRCGTVAIALTGDFVIEDRKRARAAGFAAHVMKPANIDVLVRTIRKVAAENLHARTDRRPALQSS